MNPIIKWTGGKRQLLGDILPLIPNNITTYVEPFLGGAAVLLALTPKRAVVNDANPELVNLYTVVRDNPGELLELLREHSAGNTQEYYYEIRALDRDPGYEERPAVERAARFIYLNRTCFNGLYRVNSSGYFNVPYGRYKNPDIVNVDGITAVSEYLRSNDVTIHCGGYANVLSDLPDGAFVYLDPPYMPLTTTSSFTSYTRDGFTYDDQVTLRDRCAELRERGIQFLQSNSDTPEIRELYGDFNIRTVQARRAINSNASKRGAVNEVLISG